MNGKRKVTALILMICMAASLLGGCTIRTPGNGTTVRITRNFKENELFFLENELCTVSEAKLFLMNQKNVYTGLYGEEIWSASYQDRPLYDYLKDDLRDFLVQLKCMVLMAADRGITITGEDETLITLAANEYFKSLSDEELEFTGITLKEAEDSFSDYFLANRLYRELTDQAYREISDDEARVITVQQIFLPFDGKSSLSPQESGNNMETAAPSSEPSAEPVNETEPGGTYPKETEETAPDGSVDTRQQSQTAEQLINELHRRVTQGDEDFYSVAEEYNRGEWTEATICRGETEPAFEEAAFRLSSGAISKVVTGENGFYLIKCLNNYENELTESHREELMNERRQEAFSSAYDEFVEKLFLHFNEEAWNRINFSAVFSDYTDSFYSCYNRFLSGNE